MPAKAGKFNPPFPNHGFMHARASMAWPCLCNLDQLPPTALMIIAARSKL